MTDVLGEPAEPGPLRINIEVDTDDLRERVPFLRDVRPFAVIHGRHQQIGNIRPRIVRSLLDD